MNLVSLIFGYFLLWLSCTVIVISTETNISVISEFTEKNIPNSNSDNDLTTINLSNSENREDETHSIIDSIYYITKSVKFMLKALKSNIYNEEFTNKQKDVSNTESMIKTIPDKEDINNNIKLDDIAEEINIPDEKIISLRKLQIVRPLPVRRSGRLGVNTPSNNPLPAISRVAPRRRRNNNQLRQRPSLAERGRTTNPLLLRPGFSDLAYHEQHMPPAESLFPQPNVARAPPSVENILARSVSGEPTRRRLTSTESNYRKLQSLFNGLSHLIPNNPTPQAAANNELPSLTVTPHNPANQLPTAGSNLNRRGNIFLNRARIDPFTNNPVVATPVVSNLVNQRTEQPGIPQNRSVRLPGNLRNSQSQRQQNILEQELFNAQHQAASSMFRTRFTPPTTQSVSRYQPILTPLNSFSYGLPYRSLNTGDNYMSRYANRENTPTENLQNISSDNMP